MVAALEWLRRAATFVDLWQRSMVVTTATFGGYLVLSTAAKWLLVGRWKAEEFPLWGGALPALLGRAADPAGQPARRVRGVAALQRVPAVPGRPRRCRRRRPHPRRSRCARTCSRSGPAPIVRKDTHLTGYRAVAGRIQTGPITIGADAVVGEQSRARHRCGAGRRRPAGPRVVAAVRAGGAGRRELARLARRPVRRRLPAGPARAVRPAAPVRLRAVAAGERPGPVRPARPRAGAALPRAHPAAPAADASPARRRPTTRSCYLQVLGYVAVLFVARDRRRARVRRHRPAPVPAGPARGRRVPALRDPLLAVPGVARTTNSGFYNALFGDSSAIVHYLRLLGYRFGRPLVQSGSNFGVAVRHENPYLSGVGSGTMVSDGLSFMNAEFSSTSFRLRRAQLGDRNFLGNDVAYPAERADRRQLPARDEGHGADRRGGPARRRAARLAGVRDPADGAARPRLRRPEGPAAAPSAAARQEPAQRGHGGGCSCSRIW